MRLHPCWAILVVTTIVLTGTAQAAPILLKAETVETTGSTTWEGNLSGWLRDRPDTNLPHAFQLEADLLRMETDYSDPVLYGFLAGAAAAMESGTDEETHRNAFVHGTQTRTGSRWALLPAMPGSAGATVSSTCTTAGVPDGQEPYRPRVDPNRPEFGADTRNAIAVSPCTTGMLRVEGDLVLVLWLWDIRVLSDQGESTHWSGHNQSAYDPVGNQQSREIMGEDRELYLYAYNATLTVAVERDDPVLLAGASGTNDGVVNLRGAVGDLPSTDGTVFVAGKDVSLHGDLSLDVQRNHDALSLSIEGDLFSADVAGRAVALPPPGLGAPPTWSLAAVPGLVLALWAAQSGRALSAYRRATRLATPPWTTVPTTLRERVGMGWSLLALRAVEGNNIRRAHRMVRRAIRWAPRVPDHFWIRVQVCKDLARYPEALGGHENLHALLQHPRDRARNAVDAAHVCSMMGDRTRADAWLAEARRMDAQYVRWNGQVPERVDAGADVA